MLRSLAKDFKSLIDLNFSPDKPVTDETRQLAHKHSAKHRASVRTALGLFMTDAEYREFHDKTLKENLS